MPKISKHLKQILERKLFYALEEILETRQSEFLKGYKIKRGKDYCNFILENQASKEREHFYVDIIHATCDQEGRYQGEFAFIINMGQNTTNIKQIIRRITKDNIRRIKNKTDKSHNMMAKRTDEYLEQFIKNKAYGTYEADDIMFKRVKQLLNNVSSDESKALIEVNDFAAKYLSNNTSSENITETTLKPGQTVILDNASFHRSVKTRNLIENSGCKVLFLPPYSPDLNPIEHFWFAIKHAVRKILPIFWPNINAAIDFIFQKSGKPYLR